MPYYHTKCGGEISFWTRKCKKCGKRWPIGALFSPTVPKGMSTFSPNIKIPKKKKPATYARWGDKIPFVGSFAGMLPNWPRWARITSFLGFVIILSFIIYWFFGRY